MNELVNQAKKGDPDAFTELMQSQMQNMYKAARAILNRDEDVADAISDTILACWEHLGSLKQAGYFRTWMTRILINKCYEQIRKTNRFLCRIRFRIMDTGKRNMRILSGHRHWIHFPKGIGWL